MSFTVTEVLEFPSVRTASPEVLAGEAQLSRPVRWVHSTEVADVETLLQGGELVLSVGMGLDEDPRHLRDYARALRRTGAVGLVIELREHWPHGVPTGLVTACQTNDLPLVVLHRMCRFADVIREFAERVIDDQVLELRRVERINGAFTRLAVDGAEPQVILAQVSQVSGLPVILESITGELIGYDTGPFETHEVLAQWAELPAPPRANRTTFDPVGRWLTTHVGARGEDWARLRLRLVSEGVERHTIVLLQQAATTLALFHLEARARGSLSLLVHDPVIQRLRDGILEPDLLQTLFALGMPRERPRLTAWCLRPDLVTQPARKTGMVRLEDLAYIFSRTCRALGVPCLVAVHESLVMAVTHDLDEPPGPGAGNEEHVDLVARTARAEHPLQAGVSGRCDSYEELPAALAESVAALRVSSLASGTCPVGRLSSFHVQGLLAQLFDDERLQAFTRREIGPLLEHDHEHRSQLIQTLRALLSQPSKSAAASSSHVSRAAFYERISRIEHILDVDLNDPVVRTSLHLALLVADTPSEAGQELSRQAHGSGSP